MSGDGGGGGGAGIRGWCCFEQSWGEGSRAGHCDRQIPRNPAPGGGGAAVGAAAPGGPRPPGHPAWCRARLGRSLGLHRAPANGRHGPRRCPQSPRLLCLQLRLRLRLRARLAAPRGLSVSRADSHLLPPGTEPAPRQAQLRGRPSAQPRPPPAGPCRAGDRTHPHQPARGGHASMGTAGTRDSDHREDRAVAVAVNEARSMSALRLFPRPSRHGHPSQVGRLRHRRRSASWSRAEGPRLQREPVLTGV